MLPSQPSNVRQIALASYKNLSIHSGPTLLLVDN